VLKALQKVLPHERLIYLGDTAHLPYGTKSPQTIIRYTMQNCAFLAAYGVKLIVIACNTSTAMALEAAASQFPIPIIGVIDPVIEEIVSSGSRIGILGTHATVASGAHQKKISALLPSAQITAVPAPLLVSLVEEGWIDHPMTHLAIQEYTRPLIQAQVDTVILACTHFPLLKILIKRALGPTTRVIDPSLSVAQATKQKLTDLNLLCSETDYHEPLFYVTDDPERFARLGPQFLGSPIEAVQLCELELKELF
jgi:glutamate racemase